MTDWQCVLIFVAIFNSIDGAIPVVLSSLHNRMPIAHCWASFIERKSNSRSQYPTMLFSNMKRRINNQTHKLMHTKYIYMSIVDAHCTTRTKAYIYIVFPRCPANQASFIPVTPFVNVRPKFMCLYVCLVLLCTCITLARFSNEPVCVYMRVRIIIIHI